MCWPWMSSWFGGWGGPFWMIVPMLFWLVVLGGVILFLRNLSRRDYHPTVGTASALEILKRRYAAGEINEEEYERIKSKLG